MTNEMTVKEAVKILENERDNDIFVWTEYREKIHQALTMGINAIKSQQWIPVSERLPETDGHYYVTILNHLPCASNKTSVRILDFCFDGFDYHGTTVYWGFYSGFSTSEIIAWMPLPEPFKAESEDAE